MCNDGEMFPIWVIPKALELTKKRGAEFSLQVIHKENRSYFKEITGAWNYLKFRIIRNNA